MDDHIGQILGRYRLVRLIGKGNFAEVYLGEHVSNGSLAAVKLLHIKLTDTDDLKSFINEARITLLSHPNIVQILDFGIGENDIPFLVMIYAPNGTLRSRHPRKTRLSLATVVGYVKQIATALQFAHNRELVHRDVKPENILLGAEGEILLSDFGIMAVAQSTRSPNTQVSAGTIYYMAPEQIEGKPCPASDQYALGIVVYEWLCGELPFRGTLNEIAIQHAVAVPDSLFEKVPDLSPEVEHIIRKALAKDPKERFPTISAFADALERQHILELLALSGITIDSLLLELHISTSSEDEVVGLALFSLDNIDAGATHTEVEHIVRKALAEVPKEHFPQLVDLADAMKQAVLARTTEASEMLAVSPPSHVARFEEHPSLLELRKLNFGEVEQTNTNARADDPNFNFREFEQAIRKALAEVPKEHFPQLIHLADAMKQAVLAKTTEASEMLAVSPPSHVAGLEEQKLDLLSLFNTIVLRKFNQHEAGVVEQALPADSIEITPPRPQILSSGITTDHRDDTATQPQTPEDAPSTIHFTNSVTTEDELKDFFILYNRADRSWAWWITWQLAHANYSVIFPPWHLHTASNFKLELQKAAAKAKRILLILSPDCLNALDDPPIDIKMLKRGNKLLPICVRECGNQFRLQLDSLLHIDLTGEDKPGALAILLAGIKDESIKLPEDEPSFPGSTGNQTVTGEPPFPQTAHPFSQRHPIGKDDLTTPSAPVIPRQSIEVFFSYSHKDKKYRHELENYLIHLRRHSSARAWQIKAWHDGEIRAGNDYAQEILKHLSEAHIILLLISQNFIASDYCFNIEMMKALERHDKGEARVIPIIFREAMWQSTPIGILQALPAGAKPVNLWDKREKALMNVAEGIEKEIKKLLNTS